MDVFTGFCYKVEHFRPGGLTPQEEHQLRPQVLEAEKLR